MQLKRGIYVALCLAGTFAAFFITYAKAFIHDVFGLRAYFWLLSYDDGMIRRGLTGALAAPLRATFNSDRDFLRFVSGLYHATTLFVILGLAIWCLAKASRIDGAWIKLGALLAVLLVVSSPFVGNQAYNAGWLDSLLMGVGAICFACVRNRLYLVAVILGFCGVFMHEAFMFFWTPAAALLLLHALGAGATARTRVLLCAATLSPLLAGVIIGLSETPAAVLAAIEKTRLEPATQDLLRREIFSNTPSGTFLNILRLLALYPGNLALSAIYVLTPLALAQYFILGLARSRLPRDAALLRRLVIWACLALVGLGPALGWLFVWDLSRSLSWAGFSTLLILVEVLDPSRGSPLSGGEAASTATPAGGPRRGATAFFLLGAPVVALYLSWPFVYTYYEVADVMVRDGVLPPAVLEGPQSQALASLALRYSEGHERAPFVTVPATLSCDLRHNDKVVPAIRDGACSFAISAGGVVFGPYARLRPGAYVATFRFAAQPDCVVGRGKAEVVAGAREFATTTVVTERGEAAPSLAFEISELDAVGRQLEFRVVARDGCLPLRDVEVRSR